MRAVSISPQWVVRWLAAGVGMLATAHVLGALLTWRGHEYAWGFVPLVEMSAEENLPSFYSGLLLLANALSAALVAATLGDARGRVLWRLVALGAAYLAFDEMFSVHERWAPLGQRLALQLVGHAPRYAWVVIGAPLGVAALLIGRRVLTASDPQLRSRLLFAALVYLAGGVGVEWPEGEWVRLHGYDMVGRLFVLVEETMEMSGCVLGVRALLLELQRRAAVVRIA